MHKSLIATPKRLQRLVRLSKGRDNVWPDGLLGEQVHERFLPRTRFNDSSPRGADASAKRQPNCPGVASPILIDGDEAWKALTTCIS